MSGATDFGSVRMLLIDNYDSFTYNLVQALRGLGAETDVVRNDVLTVADLLGEPPDAIVVSPGVVIARAPWAAPYSTAILASSNSMNP